MAIKLEAGKLDAELKVQAAQAAGMHASMQMHQPLSPESMHRPIGAMSDDELLGRIEMDEQSPFHVPLEIIPDGVVYQWMAVSVYGQPHMRTGSVLDAERRGWQSVPAKRHDGRWMPKGHEGPIIVEGLQLMELPEVEAYNRLRTLYLMAKRLRSHSQDMLSTAPSGTGPRTHPGVKPSVRVTRESLPIEALILFWAVSISSLLLT